MKRKYKVGMILTLILIVCLMILRVGYTKYQQKKEETTAMITVKSGLSINYLSGTQIHTKEQHYEVDFSVTNTSEEERYYYIKFNPSIKSDEITYQVVQKETMNCLKEGTFGTVSSINQIKILAGETQSYTMTFENLNELEFEGEFEIDLELIDHSLKSAILKQNLIHSQPSTLFQVPALDNEGVIESASDDGMVYYYRGAVQNNYVSFANHLWRIVKINADGTVELILDQILSESSPFYVQNEYGSTSFLESNVYQVLESFYERELMEYDSYLSSSRFCTDDSAQKEENGTIYYLPESRIFGNFKPVQSCPGTLSTSKIGLITADDAMFAGASIGENKAFYLYNGAISDSWWTMTVNKKENGKFYYISVNPDGSLQKDQEETLSKGLRPTITLIKKLDATGTGTLEDPYQVRLL